jgi:hypothetical protein
MDQYSKMKLTILDKLFLSKTIRLFRIKFNNPVYTHTHCNLVKEVSTQYI